LGWGNRSDTSLTAPHELPHIVDTTRRTIMAKGQQRKTKEAKKPKKEKPKAA